MKVTSTGRGGRGNIRSPSRDGIRADDISTETSPSRSLERGRGYDRDLISVIDEAQDGVVCGCVAIYNDSRVAETYIDSVRLAVVAPATCLAHPAPTLNHVPDPASRSTQAVVEAWGTFMSVDFRRRRSWNLTSPNVLPICTPQRCTSLFLFLFQNVGPADTVFLLCVNFF